MIKPTVVLTFAFDAPRQRVFDVFTQEEHVNRWFGHEARIDLQVGGRFSTGDGDSGRFLKVAVPRELVFTWSHPRVECPTEVDITFASRGSRGGTQVRIVQKGLDPKQVSKESYQWLLDRWNWMAENLQRILERQDRVDFEVWRSRRRQVSGARE